MFPVLLRAAFEGACFRLAVSQQVSQLVLRAALQLRQGAGSLFPVGAGVCGRVADQRSRAPGAVRRF